MTQVIIILNDDGTFDTVYSDSEIVLKVLKRGTDDSQIDKTETNFEEIIEE